MMTKRTRTTIPNYMDSPIAQVTDLEEVIKQCIGIGFKKPTIRVCSYDGGLIRNEDNKPIYLTEFQKGYLHALLSLPSVNLNADYICKNVSYENHLLYRTDGICASCKPRIMEEIERYKIDLNNNKKD